MAILFQGKPVKKALLWAISTLLFSTNLGYASDARVDSMGGLTLVATDEADDINPFTLGNPAGLALLAPQTRFDVGGQWYKEASSDEQFHIYGTMNELDNDNVKYHGLIAFLNPNWAIQADGDTLHNEGQDDNQTTNVGTNDRIRGLFRSAYNFGPFVLGGSIQPTQSNITFRDYVLTAAPSDEVSGGTGTANTLVGTAGLLLNLVGSSDLKQAHLRIGGDISAQLSPSQEIDNLPVSNTLTSNTFNLTETTTDHNVLTWSPEIYFDSPGTLQAALIGHFSTFNISFEQDSTGAIPSIPKYNAQTGTAAIGIAVFKMTNPISDSMNFKSGLLVTAETADTAGFVPAGTANGGVSINAWTAQAGVGFDHPQDYTVGVQTNLEQITGNESDSGGVTSTNNFFDYKIAVGAERWLSKTWALRLGVVYEDADNKGTVGQDEFLFEVGPNSEIITTTINAGIGYEDPWLKLDLNLSAGQPSVVNDPSIYANQYGAQLAASFKF